MCLCGGNNDRLPTNLNTLPSPLSQISPGYKTYCAKSGESTFRWPRCRIRCLGDVETSPPTPPPHYLSRVVYSNVFGKLTVRVFRENIFETQSGLTWFDDNFDLFFFYKQAFCPKTSTHSCIVSGGEFRLFGGFKTPFFDLPISVLTRPNTNRREMTTKRQTRDFVSLESYYFFVIPKTIVLDTCNFHTKCNAVAYQRAKKRCTF